MNPMSREVEVVCFLSPAKSEPRRCLVDQSLNEFAREEQSILANFTSCLTNTLSNEIRNFAEPSVF